MPDARADFQHLAIWLAACANDAIYEALVAEHRTEAQADLLAGCGLTATKVDKQFLFEVLNGTAEDFKDIPDLLKRIRFAFRKTVARAGDPPSVVGPSGTYSGTACDRKAQYKLIALRDQSVAEWRALRQLEIENLSGGA